MKLFVLCGLALAPPLLPQEPKPEKSAAPAAPMGALVETLVADLDGGAGGLEVDAKGFVYCADFGSQLGPGGTGGHRVYRVDPMTGEAVVFASGLRGASGNAIAPDGAFYQANIGSNAIARIQEDGSVSVFASDGFQSPVGIAIDSEGELFIANCGSSSIQAVSPEGDSVTLATSPLFACPNGITLDEEHNFYVSNFRNGDVLKVAWSGEVTRLATLPGKNNGHLVYRAGHLFVVARGAHQIYRVSLDGKVTLFAGSGERGHKNGPALEASFSFPNDLAFSPDGKILYVNENGSTTEPGTVLAPMTIRRIRLAE